MTMLETTRYLRLTFFGECGPIAEAIRADDPARVLEESRRLLTSNPANFEAAALYVIAHASGKFTEPLDDHIAEAAAKWMHSDTAKSDIKVQLVFGAALAELHPEAFERVLLDRASSSEDVVAVVFPLCGFLRTDKLERILVMLAQHPSEEARRHFFALLGKHQRLVPPDTIRFNFVPHEVMTTLLESGIGDSDPRVRERAIAAAYGLGLVPQLRESVFRHIADVDQDVGQYAIVALGVLTDAESRDKLLELLRTGTKEQVTSAIWALARRADGIDEVLKRAGDSRTWVNDELLGAFAEVAVPLTDDQILHLESKTSSPAFSALRHRHIARTRNGEPELGPDARITVQRR